MEIKQNLCDPRNYRTPRRGFVNYLVIHYDGNKGATDEGNANYFANNDTHDTSAHYFVDEDSVTQSVPDNACAFHCGANTYKHPYCRNDNSIGIEMCSDVDRLGNYIITEETVARTVELTKYLMKLYSIPPENVLRHYDVTGKNCPAPWVKDEKLWIDFKSRIKGGNVVVEDWKTKIMTDAEKAGIIMPNAGHKPDDPATKWFVLAVGLNILNVLKGGK